MLRAMLYRGDKLNLVGYTINPGEHPSTVPQNVKIVPSINGPTVYVRADGSEKAYVLPWQRDEMTSLTIPSMAPDAQLFVTANLSGCHIGMRTVPDGIKIQHYNRPPTQDEVLSNGIWVYDNGHLSDFNQTSSCGGMPKVEYQENARFWGEFVSGKWIFYLQRETFDLYEISSTGSHEITNTLPLRAATPQRAHRSSCVIF